MKRKLSILLSFILVLLLCACQSAQSESEMYIEPAKLTEEELAISKLLGLNAEQRILDFKVDETVQVMDIRAYELIDGQWDPFIGGPGGGMAFSDAEGRIALDFDKIPEGLRMAVQSKNHSGSNRITREEMEALAGMSWTTSLLSERTQIVYEREIPLAIQIITAKNEVRSFDTSYFFQPEIYEEYGYEHVYAVTVLFSQQPLS